MREAPRTGCLVSVIVPVYDVRPSLEECLESVVTQTYQNLEILVIDDGSTDGSGEICDRFAENDSRIRVVHQENKGLGAARNVGLDLAGGSVVAFLDSDDAFLPDAIEKALNAMIATHADITLFKSKTVKTEGRMNLENLSAVNASPQISKGVYEREESLLRLAEGKINMPVWSKIYSSALWEDLRFPEGVAYEDYSTAVRLFDKASRTVVLDDSLVFYRKRPGSITATCSLQNIRDLNVAFSHLETFVKKHTPELFSSEVLQNARRRRILRLYQQYAIFVKDKPKEKEAAREIRAMILELGQGTSLKRYGKTTRIVFFLLRFMPWSIPALRPCYHFLRGVKEKAFGR